MKKRGDGRALGCGPDKGEGVRRPEGRFEVGPTSSDVEAGATILVPNAEACADFTAGEEIFFEDFGKTESSGFEGELGSRVLHRFGGSFSAMFRQCFGDGLEVPEGGTFQWLPDMDSNHD